MTCSRNCGGSPICAALDLCCIQFHLGCGKECEGVGDGYSTVQITATGELEICTNIGGVCSCTVLGAGGGTISNVVNNNNGTFTHNNGNGDVITLDVCEMLSDAYDESPWLDVTLSAGWTAEAGMGVPQYRCTCDGRVYFRGCAIHEDLDGDNAAPTDFGTIAADDGAGHACRPPATARFQGGSNCATLEVAPDGAITTNPSMLPPTRCLDGLDMWV